VRTPLAGSLRLAASAALALGLLLPATGVFAAGPPYPDPVDGTAVYDTAGVLRDETVSRLEQVIDGIEARTGAEVVVYTQLVPPGVTTDEAERDARALMDQWGVGRKGIDDGLVILFDLNEDDPCHGQVQLYAGPGYRATYLSNEERQQLFDDELLPLLRRCDMDAAALTAIDAVDANATPAHAAKINFFRQLDAVLGLIVAPLVFIVVVAWALLTWFRVGRDPVYLDDPSIHIPAPPPGLTPAAGALVRDGKASRRMLTAATLDLAVRGRIAFEAQGKSGLFATGDDISIRTGETATGDPAEVARIQRARRRPMDPGTAFLLQHLKAMAGGAGLITPAEMLKLGSDVGGFERRVEDHVVQNGWMTDRPSRAVSRWNGRVTLLFVLGIGGIVAGANLPSQGLLLVGGALIAASIGLVVVSRVMPAVTKDGAMIRAMLEAYRRTLEKTMAQARTMGEVVQQSAIPLIESPDDAVAWGVALGLQGEVEQVLERTADDTRHGVAGGYLPGWYGVGGGGGSGWGGGGGGGLAPGLMSSSPIPNFGGMMAALSTIGNSPASSGSGGGGGGFSGGGSGGGGGGAGGGF
jgi:uncharacterized membrane protein YgcG